MWGVYALGHADEDLGLAELVGRLAAGVLLDVTVVQDLLHARTRVLVPLGERLIRQNTEPGIPQ